MTKNIKFVSIDMNEIRKSINEELAKELKEKGYEVTFSERTLQVKSIKPIAENVKTDRVKTKFELLKEDLKRRYHLKISYTESYRLRCINMIDAEPIVQNKKKKTKQNSNSEQTEQAA